MSTAMTDLGGWNYKASPTMREMENDPKQYGKTLENYRMVLQRKMMIILQDLEKIPAPVLCPFCEEPVVTRTTTNRTGEHWFNIIFVTITQLGCLTYPSLAANKNIKHECPACNGVLALWKSEMSGVWHIESHELKVYATYSDPRLNGNSQIETGQQASGIAGSNSADNMQASGYAQTQVGNRYGATVHGNQTLIYQFTTSQESHIAR